MLDAIASFVEYWLPVFIPIFLAVLSVLAGIVTGRIALNFSSLLKVHSDMVMGLFGFIVWALVTFQQTGKIHLNEDYTFSFVRVVLLVFANFFALIMGLILLNHKWSERPALARLGLRGATAQESFFNGVFLALTIVLVFSPISLAAKVKSPAEATKNKPEETYRIAIPYLDESLARQVGASNWGGRLLCEIVELRAENSVLAIKQGLAQFDESGRSRKVFPKHASAQVVVDHDRITIQKE